MTRRETIGGWLLAGGAFGVVVLLFAALSVPGTLIALGVLFAVGYFLSTHVP